MIAVLFARSDSAYKNDDDFDVYDIYRDARQFCKKMPVLAHPPCRAWGQLSHMANPREGEKELAYLALAQTLTNKTLTTPIIASFYSDAGKTHTVTVQDATQTLVGRDTTDTLTNKTLTSPIFGLLVNQIVPSADFVTSNPDFSIALAAFGEVP